MEAKYTAIGILGLPLHVLRIQSKQLGSYLQLSIDVGVIWSHQNNSQWVCSHTLLPVMRPGPTINQWYDLR